MLYAGLLGFTPQLVTTGMSTGAAGTPLNPYSVYLQVRGKSPPCAPHLRRLVSVRAFADVALEWQHFLYFSYIFSCLL